MEPIVIPIRITIELEMKPVIAPAPSEHFERPAFHLRGTFNDPPSRAVGVLPVERVETEKPPTGVTIGEVPVNREMIHRLQKIRVDALNDEKARIEADRAKKRGYQRRWQEKRRKRLAEEAEKNHVIAPAAGVVDIKEDEIYGVGEVEANRSIIEAETKRTMERVNGLLPKRRRIGEFKPETPLGVKFIICPAGDACYKGAPGKFVERTGYRDLDTDREWCSFRCWEMHEEMRRT